MVAAGLAAAAERDPREAELEALRRAIEQHRERAGAFEREERGLLETLEQMDQALEALGRDASLARREAAGARAELERLSAEARSLETRLARTRRSLAERAVALYKAGDLGPVTALFSAASLQDALERAELLQRLIDHDQVLLRRFQSERTALAEAREGAARAARSRDAALARAEQRSQEVERERGARAATLASVRSDRRRERAALDELEAAARALEETLALLQREGAPGPLPEGAAPLCGAARRPRAPGRRARGRPLREGAGRVRHRDLPQGHRVRRPARAIRCWAWPTASCASRAGSAATGRS